MSLRFVPLFLLLVSSSVYAVTVPNNFGPGTRVTNAKLNQNFQALANAITALESKLDPALTLAGLAGTYKYESISTGVSGNNTFSNVGDEGERFTGTVILNADGTFSATYNGDSTKTFVQTGDISTMNVSRETDVENFSGTWAVTGGEVVLTDSGDSDVSTFFPVAGQLLIGTQREEETDGGFIGDFYIVEILIKQ